MSEAGQIDKNVEVRSVNFFGNFPWGIKTKGIGVDKFISNPAELVGIAVSLADEEKAEVVATFITRGENGEYRFC